VFHLAGGKRIGWTSLKLDTATLILKVVPFPAVRDVTPRILSEGVASGAPTRAPGFAETTVTWLVAQGTPGNAACWLVAR
jgi:hypothetical protein